MKKNQEKVNFKEYIGMLFMFLIEIFGYTIIFTYIDTLNISETSNEEYLIIVGLLILIISTMIFNIIVHETGHLIFGLISGYKFNSFRIFSFMIQKEKEKMKLRKLNLAGTGGQCIMSPPELKNGTIPCFLYNYGGCFFNIIVSIIFLVLFSIFRETQYLSIILLFFAVTGFMTALENGIPMHLGTIDNDGYNAFALSKNKKAAEAFWMQLKIVELNAKGIRLKDMPKEWFYIPEDNEMKNNMIATRGVFTCNRLMDEQKFDEADENMEHILKIESGIVGIHRNLLICDRIYIELIKDNRREIIEKLLTKEQKLFMKSMKEYPSILRTKYALALHYEKDVEKSEEIKKLFEKCAKSYPYQNDINSERELINIANNKNEKRGAFEERIFLEKVIETK